MKLLPYLFPAVLVAGCSTTSPPTAEQRFGMADKNGDGSVSREEATRMMIGEAFRMYDADGDGFVTEEEFVASGGTREDFVKVNTSGSGKVSLEEAQASPLVFNTFVVGFDEADANRDGRVTLAEYRSYLVLRDAAVR